ncbi:MAG: hypothetical protein ACLRK9_11585 [Roseburia hominis]
MKHRHDAGCLLHAGSIVEGGCRLTMAGGGHCRNTAAHISHPTDCKYNGKRNNTMCSERE